MSSGSWPSDEARVGDQSRGGILRTRLTIESNSLGQQNLIGRGVAPGALKWTILPWFVQNNCLNKKVLYSHQTSLAEKKKNWAEKCYIATKLVSQKKKIKKNHHRDHQGTISSWNLVRIHDMTPCIRSNDSVWSCFPATGGSSVDFSIKSPHDRIIFPLEWLRETTQILSYCNRIEVVANDSQRKPFEQELLTPLLVKRRSLDEVSGRAEHFSSEMTKGNNADFFKLQRYSCCRQRFPTETPSRSSWPPCFFNRGSSVGTPATSDYPSPQMIERIDADSFMLQQYWCCRQRLPAENLRAGASDPPVETTDGSSVDASTEPLRDRIIFASEVTERWNDAGPFILQRYRCCRQRIPA